MNTTTIEVMDLAKEMGFEHWLGAEQVKGWYTCQLTGKKFRGEVAKAMLEEQAGAMNERQAEIEQGQAIEDAKAEDQEQMAIEPGEGADAPAEPKAARKAAVKGEVKVFAEKVPMGEDTLGVLHENGMIERITNRLAVHLEVKMVEGKPVKLTTIACVDCGTEREIKVQDAFQVTRCESCQKKHRNRKRAERRREKRAEAKAAAEQAE